jgi:hypothetical protein
MLVLETSNIKWLGMANKYLENQYTWAKNWGAYEISKNPDYDEAFDKELSFICEQK